MTTNQIRCAVFALIASLFLVHVNATAAVLDVWIDFDGDNDDAHDAVYAVLPGASFVGHVYIEIDNTYGGLQNFGVELRYVPDVLMGSAATLNMSNWPFSGQNNGIDHMDGRVDMVGGRLDGLVGQIHLFDVEFTATGPAGSLTILNMGDVFPMTTAFDGNVAASGFVYDDILNYLPSEVHVIPIPGATVLFVSAILASLGMWGARRQR